MLGLLVTTDPRWTEQARTNVARVLVDHAHCEMKAASNAISLSTRCLGHPRVMRALVDLAEEELRHFRQVLDELTSRGIELGAPEEDWYAAELRRRTSATRRSPERDEVLVDRLLVGALIEARSCERFKLLRDALVHDDAALSAFYGELLASEARHHRVMIDLAIEIAGEARSVRERLEALAVIEADVVRALPNAATIHG